jgi:hypothetical protein
MCKLHVIMEDMNPLCMLTAYISQYQNCKVDWRLLHLYHRLQQTELLRR